MTISSGNIVVRDDEPIAATVDGEIVILSADRGNAGQHQVEQASRLIQLSQNRSVENIERNNLRAPELALQIRSWFEHLKYAGWS